MQRPMRRNSIGFEAMDLMLDVVVEPDLSWRWKDDDEFEEIVRCGIFDSELAHRVRSAAEAVIDDIENRASRSRNHGRPGRLTSRGPHRHCRLAGT
jgi:predicted RNA-binding protein associated with RNAse of E/G family